MSDPKLSPHDPGRSSQWTVKLLTTILIALLLLASIATGVL